MVHFSGHGGGRGSEAPEPAGARDVVASAPRVPNSLPSPANPGLQRRDAGQAVERTVAAGRRGRACVLGKWTPPTVADGKLFVATSSGQFLVYELGPWRLPDTVEAALFIDDDHRLEVAWFNERDGLGWHEPVAISGLIAPPGAPVALAPSPGDLRRRRAAGQRGRAGQADR